MQQFNINKTPAFNIFIEMEKEKCMYRINSQFCGKEHFHPVLLVVYVSTDHKHTI